MNDFCLLRQKERRGLKVSATHLYQDLSALRDLSLCPGSGRLATEMLWGTLPSMHLLKKVLHFIGQLPTSSCSSIRGSSSMVPSRNDKAIILNLSRNNERIN